MSTVGGSDGARVAIAPLTRILLLVAAHDASRQVADRIAASCDRVATRALSDHGPITATDVVAVIMPPSAPIVDCRHALDKVRRLAGEVVIVTHHDHDIEIILFGAGATDVVNLDAPAELLLARMTTACRRHESRLVTPASVFECGMVSVDLDSHLLTVDGHRVRLTHLQFQIVAALVATPGRTVPLVTLAHLYATRGDQTSTRTIRSNVSQLRRTLRAFEMDIESVKGKGYRLLRTTACLPRTRWR
jgi:DNA-binding response OmpR family regulator